jgi:hypothetical protein
LLDVSQPGSSGWTLLQQAQRFSTLVVGGDAVEVQADQFFVRHRFHRWSK